MDIHEYIKKVGQTQRLYNAERSTPFWMYSEEFKTRDDAWSWLNAIADSRVYKEKIGLPLPLLHFQDKYIDPSTDAYYNGKEICLVKLRNEAVLFHEFSHHIACYMYGNFGHDKRFAGVYLRMLYNFASKEAYLDLKNAFTLHGVDYE